MSRRQVRQLSGPFPARMRDARDFADVTQEKLAQRVGVTLRTIQRWEKGETEPKGSELFKLALSLGVSAGDLYPVPEEAA